MDTDTLHVNHLLEGRGARVRISGLAQAAGLPVATVKYYLREGLLPPGELTSPTQATYDDAHLARLHLVRALIDVGGLSVARCKEVLAALDDPSVDGLNLLGTVHGALGPVPPSEPGRGAELIERLGWDVDDTSIGRHQLERALLAAAAVGFDAPDEHLDTYGRAAEIVATSDVGRLPTESREAMAAYVVTGTLLYEPVLLALRRLAQEHLSKQRFS